jgi:uncharacterized repeat protein (TIGR02543 family)
MRTKFLTLATLLLGTTIFFCIIELPTPPPGPEKATVELAFELPSGVQIKTDNYIDSLGLKTKICMNLHLTQYFDSVVLKISNDLNYSETFPFNSYSSTGSDAVLKESIILPVVGKYSVLLTGYVAGQQPRVVTASITILDRKQIVPNQKPVLEMPVLQKVGVGQTVMFKVLATDPDTNQKLTISVYKKPETATFQADSFKWSPVMADTGLDTAIFYVWDDGTPPISDTDSVFIVISPNPVNRAPVWVSQKVKESAPVGVPFSYDLSSRCYDLDNEILTFALFAEPPLNDTIKGNAYTFTPATSDTGRHTVHITVRDTSGLEDTLTLELTVTGNSVIDTKPPVFTRVKPENDSTMIHSSSYSVSVLCSDESKVESVKCFMGTVQFDVTKTGDSLYTASVSGLLPGWNIVSFAARDSSPAKNPCTLLVHMKYEKDSVDKTPPVITFKSPSKDTVISADSFEVKVTCEDDSGCSVKGFRDGTAFTLKKSASDAKLWTGMAKGIAAGSYSTIKIVAADSSFAKNKDSLTIKIKYDNDKSGPAITLVTPPKDSVTTGTSSYTIVVKCVDQSGVRSVNGTPGAAPSLNGVRDTGSLWKINVNGLENKKITAIVLTATDSSLNANKSSDTVYVNCFIENGHAVVFIKNDSAATGTMGPQTINSGDTALLSINAFAKSGSAFAGWAKTPTGAVVFADGAKYVMGTADDTLYAIWTKNSCTITFNKNGGTVDAVPATKVVSSGATVDALPTPPTRVGYTFAGWNTLSDGTGTAFTATTIVTISDTVFAQWTPVSYTITYNLNGGTNNSSNPATYTVTAPAIALANPTKTGFVFAGWFDNADLAGTAVNSIPTGSTGNKTFWAKWETNGYTITYNLDGGTNNANNPASYTVTSAAITLAAPTRTGFTFGGWYDSASFAGTAVTSIPSGSTGDKAFWAKWTADIYTITYNLNGGTNNASNPATYTVTTPAIALAGPTKAGNVFVGWFDNSSLNGTAVNSIATGSTGDKAFWAKWSTTGYTITYNLDGGTNNVNNPASYDVTTSTITLASPSKAGYTFSGWYDNAGFTGTAVTSIVTGSTGNKSFWAKWTMDTYTITYNLNNGTNSASNPASFTVTSTAITLSAPTRAGFTFGGWFDNASFSGTAVTSIPAGSTGDKAFWAKWTADIYTITYTLNSGTNNVNNPASYTVASGAITLAAPSRTGYTFGGWFDNSGLTGTAVTSIPAGSTGNKSFWAKWTIDNYAITYNLNGGTNSGSNPASYNVTTATITLAAPSRAGNTFVGWYDNSGMTGTAVTSIPTGSTGDKTFWAKWTTDNYSITYVLNGGSNNASNPTSYTVGSSTITLAAPSMNGYSFGGWYDNSGFSGTAVTTIPSGSTGNKTFYAKWTIIYYSITYTLNGGTNGSNPTSYTVTSATLSLANASRTGYTFGGWYDNSGFTGTAVTSIPAGSTGDKAFYARWVLINYSITYNLNGGTNSSNPTSYNITSSTIALNSPSKSCNNFGGWYNNPSFTGSAVTSILAGSTGDKSFYAKWTPVVYITSNPSNVSLCSITGSVSMSISATGADSYQWYNQNGQPVTESKYSQGTTTSTLTFIMTGTSGQYYCIATKGTCSAQSSSATLTVYPMPATDNITNSSWLNQQGVGGNPNNNFWIEVNPPAGTTEHLSITTNGEPQFTRSITCASLAYPEVCSMDYAISTLQPGAITVEYWTVDNSTGCESYHSTWTNPAWGQ